MIRHIWSLRERLRAVCVSHVSWGLRSSGLAYTRRQLLHEGRRRRRPAAAPLQHPLQLRGDASLRDAQLPVGTVDPRGLLGGRSRRTQAVVVRSRSRTRCGGGECGDA